MSLVQQSALALVAAGATYQLLSTQPGKQFLAIAAGCFYFVHPNPMTFGLAVLVFVDRVQNQEESNRFLLRPVLLGALVACLTLIPLGFGSLATATAQLSGAKILPALGWIDSLRTCLASPLFEEYICRIVVYAGLVKVGWSSSRALITSALFFAAMTGQPTAFLAHALAGGAYGWLYVRHGFWSAVTAHSLSNAFALLAGLLL